jgi:hypothetical protein
MNRIFSVFLIISMGCNAPSSNGKAANADSTREENIKDSSNGSDDAKELSSSSDTLTTYLKENMPHIAVINFAFCKKNMMELIQNSPSSYKEWEKNISTLFSRYTDTLSNVLTGKELKFLKQSLENDKELMYKYSNEYNRIIKSLPYNKDTTFSDKKYQSLILMYGKAGESKLNELSGLYFNLLIMDGERFVSAVEQSNECVVLYNKWLKEIGDLEFVAYADGMTPPQIIENKRLYIIEQYGKKKNESDLMKKTISKIIGQKIRIID